MKPPKIPQERFLPSEPQYAAGARKSFAVRRYEALSKLLGEGHAAARAAWGRLLFHCGFTPQLNARSVEAIAWHREAGTRPGFLNRSERRAFRRPS